MIAMNLTQAIARMDECAAAVGDCGVKPQRIRLSRRKGWRMPPNTVIVARPGPWGNPFTATSKIAVGKTVSAIYTAVPTVEDAVACFREMWAVIEREDHERFAAMVFCLRGHNLACWCGPDDLCHADVLLEITNR